jgi:NAD-specific glutamate dehydrogenase
MDILLLDTSVLEHLLNGLHRLAEQVHVNLLKLGPGERLAKVVAGFKAFNFEASRLLARERTLGLFDLALELAHSAEVACDVGTRLLLVQLDKVLNNPVVKVFATEVGVTRSREYLEHTVVDREKGHVERATAEVVHDDLRLAALLVQAIRDRGRCGLVDDTEDVQPGDGAGVLGRLTLCVVKVGRDSDNGVSNGVAQEVFGRLLHLAEDHGGDFLRGLRNAEFISAQVKLQKLVKGRTKSF